MKIYYTFEYKISLNSLFWFPSNQKFTFKQDALAALQKHKEHYMDGSVIHRLVTVTVDETTDKKTTIEDYTYGV